MRVACTWWPPCSQLGHCWGASLQTACLPRPAPRLPHLPAGCLCRATLSSEEFWCNQRNPCRSCGLTLCGKKLSRDPRGSLIPLHWGGSSPAIAQQVPLLGRGTHKGHRPSHGRDHQGGGRICLSVQRPLSTLGQKQTAGGSEPVSRKSGAPRLALCPAAALSPCRAATEEAGQEEGERTSRSRIRGSRGWKGNI